MMPCPNGTPNDAIEIHYDDGDQRKVKTFTNLQQAKQFWLRLDKAGRNPKYCNPNKRH